MPSCWYIQIILQNNHLTHDFSFNVNCIAWIAETLLTGLSLILGQKSAILLLQNLYWSFFVSIEKWKFFSRPTRTNMKMVFMPYKTLLWKVVSRLKWIAAFMSVFYLPCVGCCCLKVFMYIRFLQIHWSRNACLKKSSNKFVDLHNASRFNFMEVLIVSFHFVVRLFLIVIRLSIYYYLIIRFKDFHCMLSCFKYRFWHIKRYVTFIERYPLIHMVPDIFTNYTKTQGPQELTTVFGYKSVTCFSSDCPIIWKNLSRIRVFTFSYNNDDIRKSFLKVTADP